MNSVDYVDTFLEAMIQRGESKPDIVRGISKACIGWPYVFGAWGEECRPAARRRRVREDHPTIVSACQVLSDKKTVCSGCKWDMPVRMFDCRGFTYWALKQVGIKLEGQGATSQYNNKSNWEIRGNISDMPRDKVCCVFTGTDKTKNHTGLYLGDGSTVECSNNVQYFNPMKSKWKYFAIPAGLYDDQPAPEPEPSTDKPTLRRGDTGTYVTLMQAELINQGYDCGPSGADGKFGKNTETALKSFQADHQLTPDGICGPATWEALTNSVKVQLYTVNIPHLPLYKAEALVNSYAGAWMTMEE